MSPHVTLRPSSERGGRERGWEGGGHQNTDSQAGNFPSARGRSRGLSKQVSKPLVSTLAPWICRLRFPSPRTRHLGSWTPLRRGLDTGPWGLGAAGSPASASRASQAGDSLIQQAPFSLLPPSRPGGWPQMPARRNLPWPLPTQPDARRDWPMPGPGAMSTNNGPAQMGEPGRQHCWGPGLGTGLLVRATGSAAPERQAGQSSPDAPLVPVALAPLPSPTAREGATLPARPERAELRTGSAESPESPAGRAKRGWRPGTRVPGGVWAQAGL